MSDEAKVDAPSRRAAPAQDDVVLRLEGEPPVLVAPGEYVAIFCRARRRRLYRRLVLEMVFELLEDSQGNPLPAGLRVPMFCNLDDAGQVRRGSKFAQSWMLVSGCRPRGERMTTGIFKGRLVRVVVRTVERDQAQRSRTDLDCYSVINHLVACGSGVRP
jgi:hypothetical protein